MTVADEQPDLSSALDGYQRTEFEYPELRAVATFSAAWYRLWRDLHLARYPHVDRPTRDNFAMFIDMAERREGNPMSIRLPAPRVAPSATVDRGQRRASTVTGVGGTGTVVPRRLGPCAFGMELEAARARQTTPTLFDAPREDPDEEHAA